jgi:hypothetical protein
MVPFRDASVILTPLGVASNFTLRRSAGCSSLVSKPFLSRESTSLDMEGSVIPMWSATWVSETPAFRFTYDSVRNCGMVRSGVRRPRIWARMSLMTSGTTSSSSRVHSSVLSVLLMVILVALSNS